MTFYSRIASALLVLSGVCFGQGVLMQLPPVTNSVGVPIAGATISVFTASGSASSLSCNTPVTIYSDVGLTTPITTLQTDGFGNFPFYIAATSNPYGYKVSGAGTNTTQCYGFSSMVAPGSSPTFTNITVTAVATIASLSVSGTATLSGTNTLSGNTTISGGTNTATFQSINSILFVGTGGYASMSACLTALPSTGGTCIVQPNYSETLTATLTLKAYSTIWFMGPCTITMGANPVVLAAGVNGASIIGPSGGGVHGSNPCKWNYTGTGGAFQMGASTGDTTGMNLSNIVVDLSGANSAADGFVFKRIIYSEGHNLEALGIAGAGSTQISFLFDGTNNYTGDDEWYNLRGGLWKMIALTNGSNVNHFHTVSSEGGLQGTNGICIDVTTNSSSNTFEGVDCENGATMLHFGSTATGNTVRGVFDQGNTNSVTFDSGSVQNFVDDNSTVAGAFNYNGTDNYVNRGSNRGTSTFFGGCSGTFPSGTTSTYMSPGTTSCTAGSATALWGPFPHKLTVRNLTVFCGTAGSTAGSGAVTLLSGGSYKPLTCTVGTGTSCSDTNEAHAFTVSTGGNIQAQVVTGAGETLANCYVAFDTQ